MKIFCCLLFGIFFFASSCFSQDSSDYAFHIGKIPPEGIVLNKGWKFHSGDNPQWANPNFDDNNWVDLSPDIDVHHLLKQNKDAGIGWFRLKIKIDSSLQDSSFALVISQVVASEIYLNGQLIYRFGTVSSDYRKEETYTLRDRPFIIHFGRQDTQELAVHYSFNSKNFFINFQPNPNAHLILKSPNKASVDYTTTTVVNFCLLIVLISINLLLSLFCLYAYFSFRNEKAFLYLGLATLADGIALIILTYGVAIAKSLSIASFFNIAAHIIFSTCLILFLNAYYILFNSTKPPYYKFIVICLTALIPIGFIFYNWGISHVFAVYVIMMFEGVRVSIKPTIKKRPGAWIIFIMSAIALLLETSAFCLSITGHPNEAGYFAILTNSLSSVGLSFFIAGEFARVGLALQKRAIEVKELSDKTIAQEQERQQILATQNERLETEVQHRTAELNKSLQELKSTQAQLIQSEKMASLGELTAGIAHEIQNPLNFVNNFSEVNTELIDELQGERSKVNGKRNEELENEILNDVKQNLEKILHHGKRADAIVKGMMQHSRVSTGQKEPTDINALADEYLRLSYHGMRAKDKLFNATLETNFDNNIEKINVVPQDIGRVLLNLFNNAFYAVMVKSKNPEGLQNPRGLETYQPTVSVSTKKVDSKIEIHVKDNGTGIPQKVVDKIFQPFFTTKPTGQGTGLGLSLSYDIIKAHGGEIKVETKEGEGSEFIIRLLV
jgi:signal transduction histidine kinase